MRECSGTRAIGEFLEGVKHNFMAQVLEGLSRDVAELDLLVSSKEELLSKVVLGGSLGCSDHEVVVVKVRGRGRIREQQRTDSRR